MDVDWLNTRLSGAVPWVGPMGDEHHVRLDQSDGPGPGHIRFLTGLDLACGGVDDGVHEVGCRRRVRDAELRERLEGKGRVVPFGVEVMGRVRDFGSLDDVIEISRRTGWVRPVLDFAHLHATSDGAYTDVDPFAEALEEADGVLEPGAPFHVHFSDIAYANRNETKHLPYGEGTLRADPLAEALRRFDRPATVISESPDLESTQAIRAALTSRRRLSAS